MAAHENHSDYKSHLVVFTKEISFLLEISNKYIS
jgi:hypothetical protein